MPRKYTDAERVVAFWAKVKKTDTCWNWTAAKRPVGYGNFKGWNNKYISAHRFAYELLVGPVPEGLYLDHLCRNTSCVNPDHLEPVTNAENIRRGNGQSARNARKTHCKYGHEFTEENTYRWAGGTGRQCRICLKRRSLSRRGSPSRAKAGDPQRT